MTAQGQLLYIDPEIGDGNHDLSTTWRVGPVKALKLNIDYLTFSSLFDHKFGLINHIGGIVVFDLIFNFIDV